VLLLLLLLLLLFTLPPPQCGCQCTKCCYKGDINNCTALATGTCPYDCLGRNKTNCGVQFSSPRQSIFCAIPHTSAWPAILQVRIQYGIVWSAIDRHGVNWVRATPDRLLRMCRLCC
jgi:hypothetical protein